jgi:cGMP-dependent protein kinase
MIMTCLKNHFVFYNLDESELENIKDKMLWCRAEEGEIVYQEGS